MSLTNNKNFLYFNEGLLAGKSLHALWLRERLNDEKNLDQNSLQRLYEPSLLNENIYIKQFSQNSNTLKVTFSDGENGTFIIKDLLNEINQYDVIPNKVAWQGNSLKLTYHNYENFRDSSDLTIDMLNDFHSLGFVIVTHLSKKEGTVINFAESLGPIRSTNFGKHFDVVSKKIPNDLAYTSLGLSAHADNPYRKPIPGIQLLHCIANEAKGGNSTLVDGLAIANYLKKNEENYFDILTSTEILFRFIDKDVILENRGKLIELDDKNNFKQIRFSGRLDYVPALDPEKLTTFYKARKQLYELCASKDFIINFRLDSGMLMMFDNHRLLHGRTKYDPSTGHRHLQGCYIEHDATEGKLRRLMVK
jgi:gamma-butyrobetaine dioxygenase